VLAVEAFVVERGPRYRAAIVGLVLLTLVVLASAFLRLRLYQEAYGWTELRFYVLAAIVWLASGTLLAVGALLTNRVRWLIHAMLGLSIVFGLAFNLIGPVRYIAERNIERAVHPELVPPDGSTGLDVVYLGSLGDDALIVLAEALPTLPAEDRAKAAKELERSGRATAREPWPAWNYARERARTLLENDSSLR
jgi:Domain of unknown function (DUF4173)